MDAVASCKLTSFTKFKRWLDAKLTSVFHVIAEDNTQNEMRYSGHRKPRNILGRLKATAPKPLHIASIEAEMNMSGMEFPLWQLT